MVTQRRNNRSRQSKVTEEVDSQKRVKTFDLRLTPAELEHLRDVMGVLLPPDGELTLSQSLARSENRSMLEAKLWSKLTQVCAEAGVALGDEAPDFVVGPMAPPVLGVFQLQNSPGDGEGEEVEEGDSEEV